MNPQINILNKAEFKPDEFPKSIRNQLDCITIAQNIKGEENEKIYISNFNKTKGTLDDKETRGVIYNYRWQKMDTLWFQQNRHLHPSNLKVANESEIEADFDRLLEALEWPVEIENQEQKYNSIIK